MLLFINRNNKSELFYNYDSGMRFEDNSIGLAIPDSICTDRAIAVISAETSDITKLSSIVAHMVGHNLGLQHDSPGKLLYIISFTR